MNKYGTGNFKEISPKDECRKQMVNISYKQALSHNTATVGACLQILSQQPGCKYIYGIQNMSSLTGNISNIVSKFLFFSHSSSESNKRTLEYDIRERLAKSVARDFRNGGRPIKPYRTASRSSHKYRLGNYNNVLTMI